MRINLYFAVGTYITLCDVAFVRMGDTVVSVYFWRGTNIPKWIAVHEPEEETCRDNGYLVADFESVERIERVL